MVDAAGYLPSLNHSAVGYFSINSFKSAMAVNMPEPPSLLLSRRKGRR